MRPYYKKWIGASVSDDIGSFLLSRFTSHRRLFRIIGDRNRKYVLKFKRDRSSMCTTDVQSVAEVRRFPHIYFDGMNTRHKLANIILQKNPV